MRWRGEWRRSESRAIILSGGTDELHSHRVAVSQENSGVNGNRTLAAIFVGVTLVVLGDVASFRFGPRTTREGQPPLRDETVETAQLGGNGRWLTL